MDEIRFSDSIAKVEEQYRRWLTYPYLTRSMCDECKHWGPGVFRVHLGDFRCLKCLARDYFEDLVGKPDERWGM